MVEFEVNHVKQNYAMKLGEGGEAFFVFETFDQIPESLQTSPVVSPATSPQGFAQNAVAIPSLQEPDFLDINADGSGFPSFRKDKQTLSRPRLSVSQRAQSDYPLQERSLHRANDPAVSEGSMTSLSTSPDARASLAPDTQTNTTPTQPDGPLKRTASVELLSLSSHMHGLEPTPSVENQVLSRQAKTLDLPGNNTSAASPRNSSPPPLSAGEAIDRAKFLSKKLSISNIPSRVTESGDLMLDMTGYKTSEDQALRAESIARRVLAEELEGNYDIGALIGADIQGNLWIYSSEEAKDAARQQIRLEGLAPKPIVNDAASDPGYQSDEGSSTSASPLQSKHQRTRSEASPESMLPPPRRLQADASSGGDPNRNYAKTLRLTSEQLKALRLKPGANAMSFSVNRATCSASMYYWTHDVPIVISDIDGTITKSDALGHVLNMIGRDWTHIGVAKLYTDIVANGYNILYLTSRSVGQADTTRTYLNGVSQEGFKLPKGPVIMSPDRTMAALRREIYLRKPEVFKMACLRDILNLFGEKRNPFYAGFGNRLTDALSYRSVNIPSTRIFTINSNAEVSLDLLTLNKYKNSYVTMRELVDHFFPPVGLLVTGGGEEFTDFHYWRDTPLDVGDFSGSDSSDEEERQQRSGRRSIRSEDEGSDGLDEENDNDVLAESYLSQSSLEDGGDLVDVVLASIEDDDADFSRAVARAGQSQIPPVDIHIEQVTPAEGRGDAADGSSGT
ncbi:MAG: hypothetical protein Q9222_001251 [Ikaeria aurantiellina]